MPGPVLHVVGAGLAGLACAIAAATSGRKVVLYEGQTEAGGRCRSHRCDRLDRLIDNGSHMILGANPLALAFIDEIGARDGFIEVAPGRFPFLDLRQGRRWVVRPNRGPLPWWVLAPWRRAPGGGVGHYLALAKLGQASDSATVADCLGDTGATYERLWVPLCEAVLNCHPSEAAASLLWPVLKASLFQGERACRAYLARDGLGPNLIAPALARLAALGGEIRYDWRLKELVPADTRIDRLRFDRGEISLASGDQIVLAMPGAALAAIQPMICAAFASRAIVNVHFRLESEVVFPGGAPFLGLVGGTAQWLFARGDVLSATISDAGRLLSMPPAELAALVWREAAQALDLPATPLPPHRVIKERRATPAQTPGFAAWRPGPETEWRNLLLAGDWTDTGLPATLEGAIRSGLTAARLSEQITF